MSTRHPAMLSNRPSSVAAPRSQQQGVQQIDGDVAVIDERDGHVVAVLPLHRAQAMVAANDHLAIRIAGLTQNDETVPRGVLRVAEPSVTTPHASQVGPGAQRRPLTERDGPPIEHGGHAGA